MSFRKLGFDHGVGHPLLLLCHAKAPSYRKKKTCKDLACYSEWLKVADVVIKADFPLETKCGQLSSRATPAPVFVGPHRAMMVPREAAGTTA
jgi:hypothetical protein